MTKSIRVYTKVQRANAPGIMVGVRLQPDQLAALDAWIAAQGQATTRPEAIRSILKEKLT